MRTARLVTARSVTYNDEVIASGASKDVHFTVDRSSVVAFYRSSAVQQDNAYRDRLRTILGRCNLTLPRSEGGAARDSDEAQRLASLFCWPSGITVAPRLGIVAPVYPNRFWFHADPRNLPARDEQWKPTEKKAAWFTVRRVWKTLAKRERGDLDAMFKVCLLLAHAVSRLHLLGLAHSDLSSNNVLIDPLRRDGPHEWPGCLVIDLDTLVVPGRFPPAVLGTRGYMAPEVLSTSRGDTGKRYLPDKTTDRHALAVLIYELLLNRSPLDGPKIRSTESEEDDEFLAFGSDAIFIENPSDDSNRPKHLNITFDQLGSPLADLIAKAFVEGLHEPQARPLSAEWERALWRSLDLLHPCLNSTCLWRWFVCETSAVPSCAWCGWRPANVAPYLQFTDDKGRVDSVRDRVVCWSGRKLFRWHFDPSVERLPLGDSNPYLELLWDSKVNRWAILNHRADGLIQTEPERKIPVNSRLELSGGESFVLSGRANGRKMRFIWNR